MITFRWNRHFLMTRMGLLLVLLVLAGASVAVARSADGIGVFYPEQREAWDEPFPLAPQC